MFELSVIELSVIIILSALVVYFRIELVDTKTRLTDMEIRYEWAKNTLDAIARKDSQ